MIVQTHSPSYCGMNTLIQFNNEGKKISKMEKKIVFIANDDLVLYNFRKEIITTLVLNKEKVYILCPKGRNFNFFMDFGIEMLTYNIKPRGINPLFEIQTFFQLKKEINKIKPDIVFSFTIKPNIYVGLLSALGYKFRFFPNITGLGFLSTKKFFFHFILPILYKVTLRKAEAIFVQNRQIKNYFIKKVNSKLNYLSVPGSGVNLEDFPYIPIKSKNKNIINVLFLGRLIKEKGIFDFIRLSKEINNVSKLKIYFLIGGQGDKKMLNLINNTPTVKHLGFLNNPKEVLIDCDFLILPSRHEGLANVLLEAQAIGRPVITYNIPGCNETLIKDKSGYLVKPFDYEDLKEKFLSLCNKETRILNKMGYVGRKHVEKNFDRDIVKNLYLKLVYGSKSQIK